jgi:hypothetical protein
LIVLVGNRIDQFLEVLFRGVLQVVRNVGNIVLEANLILEVVHDRLLIDDIDDSAELVFLADGNENGKCVRAELLAHVVERVFEIRTGAVHLVDEGNTRHAILWWPGAKPFRMGLHARDAAEHSDRAVEDTHGTLHFAVKSTWPGVSMMLTRWRHAGEGLVSAVILLGPIASGRGGRNGDATLAFLFHPVGDGVAVIDIAHLVDETGIEEDALGGGRFACVNVRGDADVPRTVHRVLPTRRIHRLCLFLFHYCLH